MGTHTGPRVHSSGCQREDHRRAALSLFPQHLLERSVVLASGHAASTSGNSLLLTVEAQKGERTGQGLEK